MLGTSVVASLGWHGFSDVFFPDGSVGVIFSEPTCGSGLGKAMLSILLGFLVEQTTER